MLKVHLLGQFDVKRDHASIEIPSRPAQSLLAYLVLSAGTAHRREKLAGLLWPDANEANARSNLRHALWRLRKAIGSDHLLADKISITFNADSDYWLDATTIEDGKQDSVDILLKAVAAYGGELLPGFYEDWVVLERERLRSLFEQKIHGLLDYLVEEQRWTEALEWGERWIALGHVPEPAYRALMIAHGSLGDLAGMAAVYKRCTKALEEELGVEPSEETKSLYEWLAEGGVGSASQWTKRSHEKAPEPASAVHGLLKQWRAQGISLLDLPSLAIVQVSSPGEIPLDDEDASLLIRSALHHAVPVEPWLARAQSEGVAVAALMQVYDSYPRPRVRMKITEALKGLPSGESEVNLLRIAISDDAPPVRAAAAVEAASRNSLEKVVEGLLEDVNSKGGAAATAAFVAVADEVGLPEVVGRYPRLSVGLAIAQRRWSANSPKIRRQVVRAIAGGAIAMALVASIQLVPAAIMKPDLFQASLEFTTLPIWLLSSAILGLFWGGIQGAVVGLNLGIADTVWQGKKRGRLVWAGLAGLVYSFFYILLSLSGGFTPIVGPSIYIPIYVFDGLILGVALSLVVAELGSEKAVRTQFRRSFWASALILLALVPSEMVIYQHDPASAIALDIIFALLFPLGLALAMRDGQDGEKV